MTSISGNGTTEAIYLRQSGAVIQYSVGATPGSWTTISSWPVTIINSASASSNILNVKVTNDLTISNTYGNTSGYFKSASTYITFDGSGNSIHINSITSYPGFLQNGTGGSNAYAYSVVQNFNMVTDISGSTTLENYGGWLCQAYFGSAINTGGGVAGVFQVSNCSNAITITNNAGGLIGFIVGQFNTMSVTNCRNSGYILGSTCGGIVMTTGNYGTTNFSISNCTNTGHIGGANSGGICGFYSAANGGNLSIVNCSNSGNIIGASAGGICGYYVGAYAFTNSVVSLTNCYNNGNITGERAGGIAGDRFGSTCASNTILKFVSCYSNGNITGNYAGGITGANVGQNDAGYNRTPVIDISNCYTLGNISSGAGGICGGYTGMVYSNKATLKISSTYSSGSLVDASSGLVAISLTSTYINLTTLNTYVANAGWTDASANANLVTGVPTGVGIANKGSIWTSYPSANTPYLLSSYWSLTGASQLYTPNSDVTATDYNSPPGLYTSGTYSIGSAVETTSNAVVNVIRVLLSSPYYGYYGGTFSLTNINGGRGRPITSTINATTGVIMFIVPRACFLEGTKILCFENNEEVYRPVESLQKGDLVKTIYNGYLPIHKIGTSPIYNPSNDSRISNRLYKCPKENYPALFEDLYITGCHSILVPSLTYIQGLITKASLGKLYVTDKHCRLMAWVDEKAEPYTREGIYNIYHIALENDDYYMNYGIYANGLLVETCSKRYLTEMSNMRLLGEEDSSVTEDESPPAETIFPKMANLVEIC